MEAKEHKWQECEENIKIEIPQKEKSVFGQILGVYYVFKQTGGVKGASFNSLP